MGVFDSQRRRSWPLNVMGAKYLALRAADLRSQEVPLTAQVATKLIERAAQHPNDGGQLTALGRSVLQSGLRNTSYFSLRALLRAFESGELVLLKRQEKTAVLASRSEENIADQMRLAKQVKTWVEMVLVDMEGQPVPNKKYVCVMPDGSMEAGVTDRAGKVQFDGIDPGNCAFSLSEVDSEAWERVGN